MMKETGTKLAEKIRNSSTPDEGDSKRSGRQAGGKTSASSTSAPSTHPSSSQHSDGDVLGEIPIIPVPAAIPIWTPPINEWNELVDWARYTYMSSCPQSAQPQGNN
jgi:hypothetical protein